MSLETLAMHHIARVVILFIFIFMVEGAFRMGAGNFGNLPNGKRIASRMLGDVVSGSNPIVPVTLYIPSKVLLMNDFSL